MSQPPVQCPPHPMPTPQGILREGLEDVKQFFKVNGSCRLPLSPSLLVKGIVPRVSAGAGGVGGLLCPHPAHPDRLCLPPSGRTAPISTPTPSP